MLQMNVKIKNCINKFWFDAETTKNKLLLETLDSPTHIPIDPKLIEKIEIYKDKSIIIDEDVFRDVEFFTNYDGSDTDKNKTVFRCFDRTKLRGGSLVLKKILASTVEDVDILTTRQNVLRSFIDVQNIDDLLNKLRLLEQDILWLYENNDKNVRDLYEIVYFRMRFLKGLNSKGSCLTSYNTYRIIGSPLIGILSPIVYFIVPYFILVYKFGLSVSFVEYIKLAWMGLMQGDMLFGSSKLRYIKLASYAFSLIFYFSGLFNSVEISKTLYKISKFLVTKMNNVIDYLKLSDQLLTTSWNEHIIGSFLSTKMRFKKRKDESYYVSTLDKNAFGLHKNYGKQLSSYKHVDRSTVESILLRTYVIDALYSIVANNLSYTVFDSNDKPSISMTSLYHPCLDKPIKNDFCSTNRNNAIITGSNAAGKSTYIKSIMINILLSQSCGVSYATSCRMTAFTYINSQINIPDCKGRESLFEAEMFRSKKNLDVLGKLGQHKFAFILLDEIFNSTNVIEGIAGAYAIAKKISDYDNCMLIFTTHYLYLTKLAKDTKKFVNLKMNVVIDDKKTKDKDGLQAPSINITFPYTIERGISKDYIALELLKKNGFDTDITDLAINIKNRLLK